MENFGRSGLCPESCWGSSQHSPDPLAGGRGLLPPQDSHPYSQPSASIFGPLVLRPVMKSPGHATDGSVSILWCSPAWRRVRGHVPRSWWRHSLRSGWHTAVKLLWSDDIPGIVNISYRHALSHVVEVQNAQQFVDFLDAQNFDGYCIWCTWLQRSTLTSAQLDIKNKQYHDKLTEEKQQTNLRKSPVVWFKQNLYSHFNFLDFGVSV